METTTNALEGSKLQAKNFCKAKKPYLVAGFFSLLNRIDMENKTPSAPKPVGLRRPKAQTGVEQFFSKSGIKPMVRVHGPSQSEEWVVFRPSLERREASQSSVTAGSFGTSDFKSIPDETILSGNLHAMRI